MIRRYHSEAVARAVVREANEPRRADIAPAIGLSNAVLLALAAWAAIVAALRWLA